MLDFGIAKALAARTLVTTNKWGSMQYASPERLQSDGHVNEHADFWSLGVMLFEMLAGLPTHTGRTSTTPACSTARSGRQEAREPLPPHIDPVLAAIVQKLLAPQHGAAIPAGRRPLSSDLDAFLHGEPTIGGSRIRAGQPGDDAPGSARRHRDP